MTAPHPEMDALLDAVFDAPDDDTPRLVLADWLTEHGQSAYADFIRLQCAAAREPLWSDEANRLWEEIGRVWTRLDEEWRPATRDEWHRLPGTQRSKGTSNLDAVHFDRGFLRPSCALTYRQLVRYSGSCWPWLPLPATVLRTDWETELRALPFPRPQRVRHLRVVGCPDYGPELLVNPLQLMNLKALDLSNTLVASTDVEKLLTAGTHAHLREVRLKVYDMYPERTGLAGCVGPDVDPSTRYLQELRHRTEARFEKAVWQSVVIG